MEKLFTVHHDRYRCLAVNPAYAVRGRFTWLLTDLKPAALERAGAAQIYGPLLAAASRFAVSLSAAKTLKFAGDSPLEEAVSSELVSEAQIPC
jgi:hypothetical protein